MVKSSRSAKWQVRDRGTLTDQAYQALRRDILIGVFAPGQQLRLELLKERYRYSFSPLREALNRLRSEKLVVVSALRGFNVAEFSSKEMWDTIEARILIECEALRRAMDQGHDAWEARIIAAFYSLNRCFDRYPMDSTEANASETEELENRHREFHFSLLDACQSPSLMHLTDQLYNQTERYRRPLLSVQRRFDPRDFKGEHKALMDAVLARKSTALQLLAVHYRQTGTAIQNALVRLNAAAA